MTTIPIPIEEIVAFAQERPAQTFRLGSSSECLVCQLIAKRDGVKVEFNNLGRFVPAWSERQARPELAGRQYAAPDKFNDWCCTFRGDLALTGERIVGAIANLYPIPG